MLVVKNLKEIPGALRKLAQWHQTEWSQLNPGETLEQRIERMQHYLNDSFIPSTFVAQDNAVLGSAAIIKNDMDSRMELTPWLASVYVSAESRECGIGSKLVRHVMLSAKKHAYKKLYLFTPDRQNFYERLGWQTFDTEHYHGLHVNIMQITL